MNLYYLKEFHLSLYGNKNKTFCELWRIRFWYWFVKMFYYNLNSRLDSELKKKVNSKYGSEISYFHKVSIYKILLQS